MEAKNQPKKRTQLSFIIRDPVEKLNRSGINCIRFEDSLTQVERRLFTAGRDSIIRVYNNFSYADTNYSDLNKAEKYYQMSLSHHTDWINDIVVSNSSNTIFSASSDTTVKVWNSTKGNLLKTMKLHKDYVKCLSHAKDKNLLASAGFDKNIFIWDIETGTALNPTGLNDVKTIGDNKYSIYSLAMNNQGTVLASGSPENCIRLWDPRTCVKTMKLKGHSHNIRAIILNKDATQCLSASSDHTIRLWSLGQQRCISTIEIHTEGVWTICVNDSFTKVYSAGKDCRVYATDLRNQDDSTLICEEAAPVLSMDLGENQESLWLATSNSSIKNWSLTPNENLQSKQHTSIKSSTYRSHLASNNSSNVFSNNHVDTSNTLVNNSTLEHSSKSDVSSMSSSFLMQNPINSQPLITIKGTASIKQYHILNDKRSIITKDTDDNVSVWDVLQAKRTESLGKADFDHAIKQRQRFISIPNWFTVDLKLGLLTITLDENEWHSAWVNFKDMDSNHVRGLQSIDLSEAKVNYGCIFLESLFKNCLFINPIRVQTCETVIYSSNMNNNTPSFKTSEQEQTKPGLLRFNIPEHTPIIFSEVAGRTLHRTDVRDLTKETEQEVLSSVMPLWIIDAIVNKNNPKFNRLMFMLNPYNQANAKTINKDRLSSIDLLQVKKVKEHVYQKILKLDENANSQVNSSSGVVTNASVSTDSSNSNNPNDSPSNNTISQQQSSSTNSLGNNSSSSGCTTNANDISSLAGRTIELICSDNILNDSEMSLRTIKHLIWKGSGDLTILYRIKS